MAERHKILLVDDDPLFVRAVRMVLESEGYEVSSASNAEEGLALMRAEKPDLVVLDIMMDSILDGVFVSQTMSDDDELSDVPVVMVSSIASTEYVAQFPQDRYLHAADFLFKPVQPSDLLESVQRFLK
jgi:CheY-like chemotaxis protein